MKFFAYLKISTRIPLSLLCAVLFAGPICPPAAAQSPDHSFYYVSAAELGAAAPAAGSPCLAKPERGSSQGGYLSQAELQFPGFPAAPAAGSAADSADMAAVLQWQKDRTDAQCAAAKAQSDESFTAFFGNVSPFPSPLPAAAAAFFRKVADDAGSASRGIKNIYKRPRPFQAAAAVNPCLGRISGFSYPSGHALVANLERNSASSAAESPPPMTQISLPR